MMMTRRVLFAVLAVMLATFTVGASAAGNAPFDRAAFDAARRAGRPVLIDISASWCPTCLRQKAVIAELMRKPKYAAVAVFEVDYDTAKNIMRSFGAQERSTLIAFKGGSEVGRIVGDTRPQAIEALLAQMI